MCPAGWLPEDPFGREAVVNGEGLAYVSPQSSEDCHRQVQRILQSAAFRNASTLQQLLQFLASRALDNSQPELLKEYTIGVEAFGRPHDFDPKTDTIVRVQIHRLRQKLKEYYDSDGRHDPIVVEIPKGHYLPTFEAVAAASGPSSVPETNSKPPGHPADIRSKDEAAGVRSTETRGGPRLEIGLVILCAIAACMGLGFWMGTKQNPGDKQQMNVKEYAAGTDAVKAFWANLIGNDPNPVIAYPDAVFLLDDSNDLFRFRQGASDDRGALVDPHLARQFASNPKLVSEAGPLYYENGYTGTGELQAVAMLSGLLGQMGVQPIVKPSRDITPVDLRQHSVILLGSSFQNVAVAQLMSAGDLGFKNPDSHLEGWRAEIINASPQPGEEGSYHTERDPVRHMLETDYAIISVQSGLAPGRHLAVLGGLDTTGTEGATMFALSESGANELMKAAALTTGKKTAMEMEQFQVLVKVRLERGNEVLGASLVAVHKITPAVSRRTKPSSPAQSQ
jgi:hypothetical protein